MRSIKIICFNNCGNMSKSENTVKWSVISAFILLIFKGLTLQSTIACSILSSCINKPFKKDYNLVLNFSRCNFINKTS